MAAWKQLILALVIIIAAVAAWIVYFPNAQGMLARTGVHIGTPATEQVDAQSTAATGQAAPGGGRRSGSGAGPAIVVARQVSRATINDRLAAIGTGRANASVTVNPFDAGRLIEVAVTAGQRVAAGDVLAKLDSDSEVIALDRAKLAVSDAQDKLTRMKQLRTSRTATDVQVSDAEIVANNARLAERDAQLALDRRTIISPIAGVVGILPIELGQYVTSQTAIATIDDRSRIIVDFYVPERYVDAVELNAAVVASPVAQPADSFAGTVSAIDNRLDEKSRTLHVQAAIPNPEDKLRAGMSFQVTMKFPGSTYVAVDPLAIQWGADGSFVWLVNDGKAARTPVKIVQRNTESVLVDASIDDGAMVVTEGIHQVREGGAVRMANNSDAPEPGKPESGQVSANQGG